jgi:uncharacterized DUF497 family protein
MSIHALLSSCEGFQWDKGNSLKNWLKHRVSEKEAEAIFSNEPLLLVSDEKHSQGEVRFRAMGFTDKNRFLYIVFTVRDHLIRVISARSMSQKERATYEEFKANPTI